MSQPTIKDVWAALPESVRSNQAIMQRIQTAGPHRAASNYKDYFWTSDPDGRGMVRALPEDELLALMLCLYTHQGGTNPEAEAKFWKGVWAQ
jgi:hypothetical protein